MAEEKRKPFQWQVVDPLLEQLKQGMAPWQRSWASGEAFMPCNPTTGKRYSSTNALHLLSQGYTDQRWLTFKQAVNVAGHVRQGESGTAIQYCKFAEEQIKMNNEGRPQLDTNGYPLKEDVPLERPRMFLATVFNAEQIEGSLPPLPQDTVDRMKQRFEATLQAVKAVSHDNDQSQALQLPDRSQFTNDNDYYAAILRPLSQWTGGLEHLNRDVINPLGSEGHAREKLRVEIASMILGDELGIGYQPDQQEAYTPLWIKMLENNVWEIFHVARDAEKICDYVLDFGQKHIQAQIQTPDAILSDKPEQQTLAEGDKIYIHVPYEQKEQAKALGAHWDIQERSWYIPAEVAPEPFSAWRQETAPEPIDIKVHEPEQDRQYLAVPYEERESAKQAGALWDNATKAWYRGPQADHAKLDHWHPDNKQVQQSPAMTPEQEFAEALKSLGCVVEGRHPIMNGSGQRIEVDGDRRGETAGFYVVHLDDHPAGYIKNNRTGREMKWRSKGYTLNAEQQEAMHANVAQKQTARAEEQAQTLENVAQRIQQEMASMIPIVTPTPYLQAKGITPQSGIFTDQHSKTTYIPAMDENGKVWTMQTIDENGTKRFAKDGRKTGHFHPLNGLDQLAAAPALVISEGYATAASVSQVLGYSTVAAFDAGNLESVAKVLHEKYPDKPVIIAGDDDRHLESTQGVNTGKEKALAAAEAVGGKAIFPIFASSEIPHPENLPVITPQAYRQHLYATKALENIDNERNPYLLQQQVASLKQAQLSPEKLNVFNTMKQFTDFNDLAMKSVLGVDGLKGQIQSAVHAIVDKSAKTQQQQPIPQQKKRGQSRAARL